MFNEVYNVVALIIFSIFYFITLITSYSFSPRNTLPTSKEQIDNLINSDEIQNNKISNEAFFMAKFLQLLFILVISINVYSISDVLVNKIGINVSESFWNGSFGMVITNIFISGVLIFVIQGITFFIIGFNLSTTRKFCSWYKFILERISLIPIIKHFIVFLINFRIRNIQVNVEDHMNATLQESLDYLEDAVIPEESEELRMIRGVLRMDSVKVREIMVPRVDILSISEDSTIAEVADLMKAEGGHSKIPVFGDSIDDIVGIAYARDVLSALDENVSPESTVRNLVRKSLHVPESQSLEKFLREIQEQSTSIAVVVDEYGGVSGLITVTDLIEEIVGELTDEFDTFVPIIEKISATEVVADAGVSIDSLNQTIGTSISTNGFDTVGGLVMKGSGRIPNINDQISVEGLTMIVKSVRRRRLEKVRILINK